MAKRKANTSPENDQEPRRGSRRISNINGDQKSAQDKKTATKAKGPTKASKPKALKKAVVKPADEPIRNESGQSKKASEFNGVLEGTNTDSTPSDHQYWLMKAEPESRLEKGHDIKFSIDDLAAKTEPEPWDGIRAYPGKSFSSRDQIGSRVNFCLTYELHGLGMLSGLSLTEMIARNNLRAMRKGDLAFFYHSSCKVPAIVGIMEIVREHSPDLSAHDPSAPYHDPSSIPANPKWSMVHVEFRQKLETPITLKDLKAFQSRKGNPLENMQMLKLTRLSVSKVNEEEWNFLVEVMEDNGDKLKV